ncbi:tRNA-dependent cyclodipeptide synthase [Cyanobium sp. Candia 9D4]|uniref:tRNA-dependent cyclodipeptide synthase n=1 Tax=Cyanobium sp. Candia 9D4 TaxID=2823707 RepID=UPI0020CB6B44|nr:tRNA-dependent cyclodipeptide synthase [Cyanobium sp. Candia 9D4]MCP9932766.1 tRNA-dependent cyclodipeptide synthase [Cyanobium sp. Candia 9D4]
MSSYSNGNLHRNTSYLSRCLPDRGERFHAVVGTSPFTSYYSEGRLTELLAWANEHLDRVDVFVPDTPTVWTLEAGGYVPEVAARKTSRQVRHLNNKIGRAREAAGTVGNRLRLRPWTQVTRLDRYTAFEHRSHNAFATDRGFQQECLAATDDVLQNRRREGHHPSYDQRLGAVDYLMAELALILYGPELFGVQTSTFVYHRSLRLFERIFSGDFWIGPSTGQHFVIAQQLAEPVGSLSREAA